MIQLDPYLMPKESPYSKNQGVIDGQTFGATYDRGIITNPLLQNNSVSTVKLANLSVTNAKIVNMDADKISAGTIIVGFNIGAGTAGYVLLDGANNRILVNDGTTNRVVIGSV